MGLPFTYRGMTLVDGSFSVRGIHIGLDTYKKRSEKRPKADMLWNVHIMKKYRISNGKTQCKGVNLLKVDQSNNFHIVHPGYKKKCGKVHN